MHIAAQMWQFYVFNMSCNVSLSCRFMPQKCHRRVLNVSVFNTSCNILLSCHFKSEILPKYTRFMVLYARNLRVLLRNCICFTFSTGLVMYASYRLTSKNTPETHRYALQILLNTPILSWQYDRNSRILLRKCIRFTSWTHPIMCLFHVLLRRKKCHKHVLMCLFSSSTRPVVCLFRVVLHCKY